MVAGGINKIERALCNGSERKEDQARCTDERETRKRCCWDDEDYRNASGEITGIRGRETSSVTASCAHLFFWTGSCFTRLNVTFVSPRSAGKLAKGRFELGGVSVCIVPVKSFIWLVRGVCLL